VKEEPSNATEIANIVRTFPSPFFNLNRVDREAFINTLPIQEILEAIQNNAALRPLTFVDVFDETSKVGINEAKKLVGRLSTIDERVIQNAIRNSLREKNATNPTERAHDSALEVADHEHFSLRVKGVDMSFAGVVKGYKSVGGATVTWKDIAHQVMKAFNRTKPDHVLLVLAKNPADSVVSEATEYGRSIGNVGLVIVCDPLTLARFLKARNAI
jgi:hypothetical protein